MPAPSLEALTALLAASVEPPEEVDLGALRPWRDRIDAIDTVVIYLLNQRAVCAAEIGDLKRQMGLPVYVPTREEEVLDNVMAANPGPLPDEAVRRLYERVIDETRSLERRLSERPAAPVSGGSNQDERPASDRSPDNSGT
ncbi:MAG: chorismate mutase [Bacteroidota bacterium]